MDRAAPCCSAGRQGRAGPPHRPTKLSFDAEAPLRLAAFLSGPFAELRYRDKAAAALERALEAPRGRDGLAARDGELERVIRQQNTRFTTMLSVAIVMSMAALTAVVVFGYLGYQTLSHMGK